MSESAQHHPLVGPSEADEARRTAVALFRYTTILPLLRHNRDADGSKKDIRAAIAARSHTIPHSPRTTISVPTLRRWEKTYRQGGFEALKPKPRADRGQSRALSDETLERAEALKRELPTRSARTIVDMLRRDSASPAAEPSLAERTLRRHLHQRGLTRARLAARSTAFRRFQRSHFGDLWQSDAMDGPSLPDPAHPETQRQTFLFAFIDDYSRLVPHAQFYWNEQTPRLENCLQHAISRYGCPLAIYADQGQVYRSNQLDTACATLGIQRILAQPYSPQAKGKIERFFGFVQSAFIPELTLSVSVNSLDDLNQALLAWIEVVYHRKVHSETGQTPLDRYHTDDAPAVRPVDPLTLRNAFLFRAARRVDKTAHVAFQGNRYTVPGYLSGQTIELRYDPFDLANLEVWLNNQSLAQAQPTHLKSTVEPGLTPDPTPPAPPSTGLDYLALLRQEHLRLLREQFPTISFTRMNSEDKKG
ncbi:MAG: DDE-type integrase/transposase/recombinase [Anaerolineae bacterium]|nr:DDE-type integrase/transposase/recombinase [Anaerolineae bacterium]